MYRGLAVMIAGVVVVALWGQVTATSAGFRSVSESAEPARLMRSITVITTFADGTSEVKQGQGFVMGHRLFTVYHTLAPPLKNVSPTKREIYVAGTLMTPRYIHAAHDIAIFEMPKALCKPHCNAFDTSTSRALKPNGQVYWVQDKDGKRLVQEGRVRHYAWLSEAPPALPAGEEAPCQNNLIVEVDTPFRPGTSGSPVFDATTDAVVGMIQGSLSRANGDTGYFKPIACLLLLAQL